MILITVATIASVGIMTAAIAGEEGTAVEAVMFFEWAERLGGWAVLLFVALKMIGRAEKHLDHMEGRESRIQGQIVGELRRIVDLLERMTAEGSAYPRRRRDDDEEDST